MARKTVKPTCEFGRQLLRPVDSFSTDRGEFLYVSIQNARETGGVECRIRVNGVVIETAKSTGAYVIATCSGAA